jgi:hypothetical protein
LRLTIDSTEPLQDTLRVVGAIYNVNLEVSANHADPAPSRKTTAKAASAAEKKPRSRARTSSNQKRSSGRRARTSANNASSVNTSAVRSWARENGYTIAARGRVPTEVVAAYREANPA